MKPQRDFVAERPLAQHCAELLRKGPGPDDLLPLFKRMGERLARRLTGALAPLLGGEAPVVRATEPRMSDLENLFRSVASLAANSVFTVGGSANTMLVSIEADPVLRIVDRAFGGKGEAPAPMPDHFPMAAELMITRLETLVAEHLSVAVASVSGAMAAGGVPEIAAIKRDSNLAALAPFPETQPIALLNMEVDDGGVLPWLMSFAMPLATLARLFGFPENAVDQLAHAPNRPMASPLDAPFAQLPLSVSAVLVDMALPFSVVAEIAPGMVLPVAVARQIPLKVGDTTIAHGTVGAIEDRMAIQLSSAFQENRSTAS